LLLLACLNPKSIHIKVKEEEKEEVEVEGGGGGGVRPCGWIRYDPPINSGDFYEVRRF
jgi:hypothetical protein